MSITSHAGTSIREVGLASCGVCGGTADLGHLDNCAARNQPIPTQYRGRVRPVWDEYFFRLAGVVATRATCPRAHIGCVIVDPETRWVLATGYNGSVAGAPHCDDVGCRVLAEHCVRSAHAESNAVLQYRTRTDLDDIDAKPLVAYVFGPRPVCSHCAQELYSIGVRRVEWRTS